MSITNFLNQDEVSQSWVNLRANTLQLDSNLILSPSAQNVLALSVTNQFSVTGTSQALSVVNLSAVSSSDISPIGISWVATNITVQETGYYLFDMNLQFQINIFNVAENFDIQLWNNTDVFTIIGNSFRIPDGNSYSLQLNRLVNLIAGKNYQILINQQTAQNLIIYGGNLSYVSIIKLF